MVSFAMQVPLELWVNELKIQSTTNPSSQLCVTRCWCHYVETQSQDPLITWKKVNARTSMIKVPENSCNIFKVRNSKS